MCVGLAIITIGLSTRLWSGSCRSQRPVTSWWLDLDVNLWSKPWSRNKYCTFWSHLGCLGWNTNIFHPHRYKWFISQYLFRIIWKKIIAVIDTTFAVVEKKAWKNSGLCGIWTLDLCDTRVQHPIHWSNKPTGSRSLNWFVLNLRRDDDEVKNIWKSYMTTAGWRIIGKKNVAVIDATFAAAERKPFGLLLLNTLWGPFHFMATHPLMNEVSWLLLPKNKKTKGFQHKSSIRGGGGGGEGSILHGMVLIQFKKTLRIKGSFKKL